MKGRNSDIPLTLFYEGEGGGRGGGRIGGGSGGGSTGGERRWGKKRRNIWGSRSKDRKSSNMD